MGDESSGTKKIPLASLALILVLSLATWWFFYAQSVPLDRGATAIVVGIWTAVVLLIRWMWHLSHKSKTAAKEQK